MVVKDLAGARFSSVAKVHSRAFSFQGHAVSAMELGGSETGV